MGVHEDSPPLASSSSGSQCPIQPLSNLEFCQALVGELGGWITLLSWPFMFAHVFFWIVGTWAPWWVVAVTGAWVLGRAFAESPPNGTKAQVPFARAHLRTVVIYAWMLLWFAHFAPQAHWPIIR
jgi:hypothetical protein